MNQDKKHILKEILMFALLATVFFCITQGILFEWVMVIMKIIFYICGGFFGLVALNNIPRLFKKTEE